jgi:asparagine N-glycosylation enzyme membrane subunit Stt3
MTTGKAFGFMVLFAFLAILAFCQIDSAHADEKNLNGIYIAATVVLGLVALVFLGKTSKGGSPSDSGSK